MTSLFLYLTKTRIPYTFFMLSCLRYYIYNFTKKIMHNLIPTCIIQLILTTYTTSFIWDKYLYSDDWMIDTPYISDPPFHFLFSCIHMHFSCSPWFFLFFFFDWDWFFFCFTVDREVWASILRVKLGALSFHLTILKLEQEYVGVVSWLTIFGI